VNKKTLLLGASENPARYSNMAIKRLRANGHDVVAIGRTNGQVEDVEIRTDRPQIEDLDTVTIYLNPTNQQAFESYILELKPRRIIFNPGAENPDLAKKATANNIETMEACTLVMLTIGMY
jgi:predicted CoA-binding protein